MKEDIDGHRRPDGPCGVIELPGRAMGQTIVASMKKFAGELMRRNVLRAGTIYLALSWVVLQLTVTISGRTSAPPEVAQAVGAILALGFVTSLVLAWLYEVTPQGFTRTKDVSEEQSITHTTARRLDHIILGALALVAVVALVDRLVISRLVTRAPIVAVPAPVEAPKPPPVIVQSLAVLPFAVAAPAAAGAPATAPAPDTQALADGFTRALRDRLAGLSGLKVAGNGSAFYFAGKPDTSEAIAQALHVDHLLRGTLTVEGERISLGAELVDPQVPAPLWSQSFDIAPAELATTEEAIARAAASALQIALSPADETRLAKRATSDAGAHRLDLMASARLGLRDLDSLKSAKSAFEDAIARDANDSAAYEGLAETYVLLMVNYGEDIKDGEAHALEAAEKALALDPEAAGAYLVRANLARLRVLRDDNIQAHTQALADYRRAVELDPADADAFEAYGSEMVFEDPAQALDLFRKALDIDPFMRQATLDEAVTMGSLGDVTGALNGFERLTAAHPDFSAGYSAYGLYQARLGRLDEAAVLLGKAFELSPDPFSALYLWAVRMELGDTEAARALRDRIKGADLFDALRKALGFAAAGKYADELQLLEKSVRAGTDGGRFVHAAAILALAQKDPQRALDLLQQRFPTLFAGETINVLNFAAALDLAVAWQATGNTAEADGLLKRVAAFLEGPSAPKLPLFLVAKAQAHALQGALDQAMVELDQAFDAGFRLTWAVLAATRPGQLNPFPIEIDPRLGALRGDPRFVSWLSRIKDENAAQAAALKQRLSAPTPPAN